MRTRFAQDAGIDAAPSAPAYFFCFAARSWLWATRRENVLVGKVGRPAVGGGHGLVEVAMRVDKPLRLLVVEVGQRALVQYRLRRLRLRISLSATIGSDDVAMWRGFYFYDKLPSETRCYCQRYSGRTRMSNGAEKTCFVICPIGAAGSQIRARSDDILENLIKPIAADFGFRAYRQSDNSQPGEITDQIVKEVVEANLVVADLTGLNPNVFYELAIRHFEGRPFIQIASAETLLPFDIKGISTVFIDHSSVGALDACRAELKKHFSEVVGGRATFSNPFSRYRDRAAAEQSLNPQDKQLLVFAEQIEALKAEVRELSASSAAERARSTYSNNALVNALLSTPTVVTAGSGLGFTGPTLSQPFVYSGVDGKHEYMASPAPPRRNALMEASSEISKKK